MKLHSLLPLAASVLIAACAPKLPQGGFTLDGTAEGLDGTPIYLTRGTTVDTCIITEGKFHFEGVLDAPVVRALLRTCDAQDYRSTMKCSIYLEPAAIQGSGFTAETFRDATFTGSATELLAEEYDALMRPITEKFMEIQESMTKPDTTGRAAAMAEYQALAEEYRGIMSNFMSEHADSYLALEDKASGLGQQPFEGVKALFDSIPAQWKETEAAKKIGDEYNALKAIQPGAEAPDIVTHDLDGNPVKLSDFRGHYVILDFWASWCKPCRASNPHLLSLFDKYKEKGLTVFCVADDDSDPSRARTAIEQDGTQGFIHTLRGLKQVNGDYDRSEDKSNLYAVHYLPTKFLIDPEGKIVFKIEEDEQIDAKLQEAYGF